MARAPFAHCSMIVSYSVQGGQFNLYLVSSQIQLTSQVFPPSGEKDCSIRADCGEMLSHMSRIATRSHPRQQKARVGHPISGVLQPKPCIIRHCIRFRRELTSFQFRVSVRYGGLPCRR